MGLIGKDINKRSEQEAEMSEWLRTDRAILNTPY